MGSKISNTKKSAYNIVFSIGSQLLIAVVGLLLPRLFISSFGSETNGFLSSINQVFSYIVLLEAGVGAATVQALYKPVATDDKDKINGILSATAIFYRKTGFYYLACVAALAVIYPLVVASNIPWWQQSAVILVVGGTNSIGYFVHAKFRMLLRADGRQYAFTNAHTLVQIGTSLSKVLMILLGCNIVFVQLGHTLLVVCLAIYITWYSRKNYPWLNLKVTPDVKSISQKNSVLVHEISQMVFNHTDVLILTFLTDLRIVSVYTIYNTIVDMVSTLISNVNNGFAFRMGQIFNTDKSRYIRIYDIYETLYMCGTFILYCVTYLCLTPFMKLYMAGVTDANYFDRWLPLLFILIKLLQSGRSMAGITISYAGHFKQTKIYSIIEVIINLSISVAGVYFFGIYGVLIGTIFALLYRSDNMIRYTNKIIFERKPWRTYVRWFINIIVFAGIVVASEIFPMHADDFVELIMKAGLCLFVVSALFLCINFLCYKKCFMVIKNYYRNLLKRKKKY